MDFLVALRFLTTIPVPWVKEIKPKQQGNSLAYFPVVGLLLGIILAISDIILSIVLPGEIVNVALVVILIAFTGALHLDGFIDTCDGALAPKSPEERLQIMADTRVGAFGVVGAAAILLMKYAALSSLSGPIRIPALLLMPLLARWAVVYSIYSFPYAPKKEGMGLAFKRNARALGFVLATLITLVVVVALGMYQRLLLEWVVLFAAVWVFSAGVSFFLKRRLGGLTGDTYGAIVEVSEVAFIVFIFIYFNIRLLLP